MNLSLKSLENAVEQLEKSLKYYHSDIVQSDPELVLQLRAASIQSFEFTYELSWKMLKRYLKMTAPNPDEIEALSFPDLIRRGSDKNLLLSDVKRWNRYRQERGATSHTYDSKKAQEIFEKLPAFLEEAKYLLQKLQERVSE
jgi:nucleotidyltransferase substrate binding protein (TIGR01987 family)